jgi:hypothetical protein
VYWPFLGFWLKKNLAELAGEPTSYRGLYVKVICFLSPANPLLLSLRKLLAPSLALKTSPAKK